MRVLLIGAPGSGKGTQAVRIADHFGITHISSGDLLRQHVSDGTALGRTVSTYVSRGDLVPDEVVLDMLYEPVVAATRAGGYVLDGFPRSVEQARAAYALAKPAGADVQIALFLDVPDDELVRRLSERGRGDEDTRDVIMHRLRVFREQTAPLIEHYRTRAFLIAVDGARAPDIVTADVVRELATFAESADTADASS